MKNPLLTKEQVEAVAKKLNINNAKLTREINESEALTTEKLAKLLKSIHSNLTEEDIFRAIKEATGGHKSILENKPAAVTSQARRGSESRQPKPDSAKTRSRSGSLQQTTGSNIAAAAKNKRDSLLFTGQMKTVNLPTRETSTEPAGDAQHEISQSLVTRGLSPVVEADREQEADSHTVTFTQSMPSSTESLTQIEEQLKQSKAEVTIHGISEGIDEQMDAKTKKARETQQRLSNEWNVKSEDSPSYYMTYWFAELEALGLKPKQLGDASNFVEKISKHFDVLDEASVKTIADNLIKLISLSYRSPSVSEKSISHAIKAGTKKAIESRKNELPEKVASSSLDNEPLDDIASKLSATLTEALEANEGLADQLASYQQRDSAIENARKFLAISNVIEGLTKGKKISDDLENLENLNKIAEALIKRKILIGSVEEVATSLPDIMKEISKVIIIVSLMNNGIHEEGELLEQLKTEYSVLFGENEDAILEIIPSLVLTATEFINVVQNKGIKTQLEKVQKQFKSAQAENAELAEELGGYRQIEQAKAEAKRLWAVSEVINNLLKNKEITGEFDNKDNLGKIAEALISQESNMFPGNKDKVIAEIPNLIKQIQKVSAVNAFTKEGRQDDKIVSKLLNKTNGLFGDNKEVIERELPQLKLIASEFSNLAAQKALSISNARQSMARQKEAIQLRATAKTKTEELAAEREKLRVQQVKEAEQQAALETMTQEKGDKNAEVLALSQQVEQEKEATLAALKRVEEVRAAAEAANAAASKPVFHVEVVRPPVEGLGEEVLNLQAQLLELQAKLTEAEGANTLFAAQQEGRSAAERIRTVLDAISKLKNVDDVEAMAKALVGNHNFANKSVQAIQGEIQGVFANLNKVAAIHTLLQNGEMYTKEGDYDLKKIADALKENESFAGQNADSIGAALPMLLEMTEQMGKFNAEEQQRNESLRQLQNMESRLKLLKRAQDSNAKSVGQLRAQLAAEEELRKQLQGELEKGDKADAKTVEGLQEQLRASEQETQRLKATAGQVHFGIGPEQQHYRIEPEINYKPYVSEVDDFLKGFNIDVDDALKSLTDPDKEELGDEVQVGDTEINDPEAIKHFKEMWRLKTQIASLKAAQASAGSVEPGSVQRLEEELANATAACKFHVAKAVATEKGIEMPDTLAAVLPVAGESEAERQLRAQIVALQAQLAEKSGYRSDDKTMSDAKKFLKSDRKERIAANVEQPLVNEAESEEPSAEVIEKVSKIVRHLANIRDIFATLNELEIAENITFIFIDENDYEKIAVNLAEHWEMSKEDIVRVLPDIKAENDSFTKKHKAIQGNAKDGASVEEVAQALFDNGNTRSLFGDNATLASITEEVEAINHEDSKINIVKTMERIRAFHDMSALRKDLREKIASLEADLAAARAQQGAQEPGAPKGEHIKVTHEGGTAAAAAQPQGGSSGERLHLIQGADEGESEGLRAQIEQLKADLLEAQRAKKAAEDANEELRSASTLLEEGLEEEARTAKQEKSTAEAAKKAAEDALAAATEKSEKDRVESGMREKGLEAQLAALNEAGKASKDNLRRLEQEKDGLERANRQLQSEVETQVGKLDELQENAAMFGTDKADLEKAHAEAMAALQQQLKALREEADRQKEQAKEVGVPSANQDESNRALQDQIADLTRQLEELRVRQPQPEPAAQQPGGSQFEVIQAGEANQAEIDRLREELEKQKAEFAQKEVALKEEARKAQEEQARLQREMAELQAQIAAAKEKGTDVEKLTVHFAEKQEALKLESAKVDEFTRRLQTLGEEHERAVAANAEAIQAQLAELEALRRQAEDARQKAETEMGALKAKTEDVRKAIQKMQLNSEVTTFGAKKVDAALAAKRLELEQLNSQGRDLQARIDAAEKLEETLKARELAAASKEQDLAQREEALRKQLDALEGNKDEKEIARLTAELERIQGLLQSAEESRDLAITLGATQRLKLTEQEEQLKSAKERADSNLRDSTQAEKELHKVRLRVKELEAAAAKTTQKTAQGEAFEDAIKTARKGVITQKDSELDQAARELREARERIRELEEQLKGQPGLHSEVGGAQDKPEQTVRRKHVDLTALELRERELKAEIERLEADKARLEKERAVPGRLPRSDSVAAAAMPERQPRDQRRIVGFHPASLANEAQVFRWIQEQGGRIDIRGMAGAIGIPEDRVARIYQLAMVNGAALHLAAHGRQGDVAGVVALIQQNPRGFEGLSSVQIEENVRNFFKPNRQPEISEAEYLQFALFMASLRIAELERERSQPVHLPTGQVEVPDEAALRKLREQLEQERQQHAQRIAELEAQIAKNKGTAEELERAKAALQKEKEDAATLAAKVAEFDKMKEELEAARARLAELEALKATVIQLGQADKATKEELRAAKESGTADKARIEELTAQVATSSAAVEAAQRELEQARERHTAELQRKDKEIAARLAALQKELEAVGAGRDQLQAQMQDVSQKTKGEVDELEGRLRGMNRKYFDLRLNYDSLLRERQRLAADNAAYEAWFSHYEQQIRDLEADMQSRAELQEQLVAMTAERDELSALLAEKEGLKEELAEAQRTLREDGANKSKMQAEIERLQGLLEENAEALALKEKEHASAFAVLRGTFDNASQQAGLKRVGLLDEEALQQRLLLLQTQRTLDSAQLDVQKAQHSEEEYRVLLATKTKEAEAAALAAAQAVQEAQAAAHDAGVKLAAKEEEVAQNIELANRNFAAEKQRMEEEHRHAKELQEKRIQQLSDEILEKDRTFAAAGTRSSAEIQEHQKVIAEQRQRIEEIRIKLAEDEHIHQVQIQQLTTQHEQALAAVTQDYTDLQTFYEEECARHEEGLDNLRRVNAQQEDLLRRQLLAIANDLVIYHGNTGNLQIIHRQLLTLGHGEIVRVEHAAKMGMTESLLAAADGQPTLQQQVVAVRAAKEQVDSAKAKLQTAMKRQIEITGDDADDDSERWLIACRELHRDEEALNEANRKLRKAQEKLDYALRINAARARQRNAGATAGMPGSATQGNFAPTYIGPTYYGPTYNPPVYPSGPFVNITLTPQGTTGAPPSYGASGALPPAYGAWGAPNPLYGTGVPYAQPAFATPVQMAQPVMMAQPVQMAQPVATGYGPTATIDDRSRREIIIDTTEREEITGKAPTKRMTTLGSVASVLAMVGIFAMLLWFPGSVVVAPIATAIMLGSACLLAGFVAKNALNNRFGNWMANHPNFMKSFGFGAVVLGCLVIAASGFGPVSMIGLAFIGLGAEEAVRRPELTPKQWEQQQARISQIQEERAQAQVQEVQQQQAQSQSYSHSHPLTPSVTPPNPSVPPLHGVAPAALASPAPAHAQQLQRRGSSAPLAVPPHQQAQSHQKLVKGAPLQPPGRS